MGTSKKKKLTVKVKGVEIDLENLEDEDIAGMTPQEVTEAVVRVLQNTDKETQRELVRGIMRYIRWSGFGKSGEGNGLDEPD